MFYKFSFICFIIIAYLLDINYPLLTFSFITEMYVTFMSIYSVILFLLSLLSPIVFLLFSCMLCSHHQGSFIQPSFIYIFTHSAACAVVAFLCSTLYTSLNHHVCSASS